MASKLALYNMALGHLAERKLASLTENREPRRVLDDLYDQEIAYCLERKLWNFAYRAVQIDNSSTVTPAFGFSFAFTIPDDWIRTRSLSPSPTFSAPLIDMKEEAGYWYANVTPIYVQYNSNDALYGKDLGRWPASFTDYVALRFARQACKRITGEAALLNGPQGLIAQEKRACTVAAANCAMNDPIGFQPVTGWVRSRAGFSSGDQPTGTTLIP